MKTRYVSLNSPPGEPGYDCYNVTPRILLHNTIINLDRSVQLAIVRLLVKGTNEFGFIYPNQQELYVFDYEIM